jgi:hypothetical protein
LSESDFEKLLLEAIDEGLASLGDSSKQAIYFHLEKSFDIKKNEIPRKVEPFKDALERIFGRGANFIETLIIKRLSEKVEADSEAQGPTNLTLSECVAMAKRNFLEDRKTVETQVGPDECKRITVED